MRPIRLDLEGFASFRQPTSINFDDADLFVLSGPTGAGKSSVIDAMTFALYGTVARYDDRRVVAPVISNGRNEARVALQFSVGSDRYTAVRVVRRTANGATTKEARLEQLRGEDPSDTLSLAKNERELTAAVESILGLGYEHFTTTIVLPQGAFQEFLHAKASDRQDLLVKLLDLEVFGNIGKAARNRAATAAGTLTSLQTQIDSQHPVASDEAIATAVARVTALAAGIEAIEQARPKLAEVREQGAEQARTLTHLRDQVELLAALKVPDGIDDLAGRMVMANEQADEAAAVVRSTQARIEELDTVVDELPSADAISTQQERLRRRTALAEQVATATSALEKASSLHRAADRRLVMATDERAGAADALATAQRSDLVATLTADVTTGDPCPVCARPLDHEVHVDGETLAVATTALDRANAAVEDANRVASDATTDVTRCDAAVTHLSADRDRLATDLAAVELPTDTAGLELLAKQVTTATRDRAAARTAARTARAAVEATARAVHTATAELDDARRQLDMARDAMASLGPPSLPRDDLPGGWATLAAWASGEHAVAAARVATAQQDVEASRGLWRQQFELLHAQLNSHDVDIADVNDPDGLRDRFVAAHAHTGSQHQRLVDARQRVAELSRQLTTTRRDHVLAEHLGRLLDRSHFEKWLLARAINRLVTGATHHLRQLTDNAYSLRLQPDGSFGVVDHVNGDQVRSARTLSGGETFLASMSLALALSDHVADLAASGAARLESLFIDEGFGTLDAATIDVVRATLEELGATGRMVGVVTHVQALAEQLPVQFRVTKQAQTSVVERVDM